MRKRASSLANVSITQLAENIYASGRTMVREGDPIEALKAAQTLQSMAATMRRLGPLMAKETGALIPRSLRQEAALDTIWIRTAATLLKEAAVNRLTRDIVEKLEYAKNNLETGIALAQDEQERERDPFWYEKALQTIVSGLYQSQIATVWSKALPYEARDVYQSASEAMYNSSGKSVAALAEWMLWDASQKLSRGRVQDALALATKAQTILNNNVFERQAAVEEGTLLFAPVVMERAVEAIRQSAGFQKSVTGEG